MTDTQKPQGPIAIHIVGGGDLDISNSSIDGFPTAIHREGGGSSRIVNSSISAPNFGAESLREDEKSGEKRFWTDLKVQVAATLAAAAIVGLVTWLFGLL